MLPRNASAPPLVRDLVSRHAGAWAPLVVDHADEAGVVYMDPSLRARLRGLPASIAASDVASPLLWVLMNEPRISEFERRRE